MSPIANYRCENCGESFPLMLDALPEIVVGGIHCPVFQRHGPGCTLQVFKRIWDPPHIGRVDGAGGSPPR